MIHVRGVDVAVLPHPGSGQVLRAFGLERNRAVGILKNAKRKEYVKKQVQAVKALGWPQTAG